MQQTALLYTLVAMGLVPFLPPQGCIPIGMGLAEIHFPALRAADKEHRRPQSPQRQRPIGDIEPRRGSGGRADKAQEGKSSAAESDANDRTPPQGASGQGYHGHMRNADDDP